MPKHSNRRREMQNSSSEQPSNQPDTHVNWRDFQSHALKDQVLSRKIAAKSLNIPWGFTDEMRDIKVDNGIGKLGLAAIGIGGPLLLAAGMLAGGMFDKDTSQVAPVAPVAPAAPPAPAGKTTVINKTSKETFKLGPETVIPPK